jgi:hypothetical protein
VGENRIREEQWKREKDERRRDEMRRIEYQDRIKSEERRRGEERRRLDDERHKEALRISERLARERALLEKRRREEEEEESRNRDRWAHQAEMQPGPSTHTMNSSRIINVSLNSAAPRAPSNMVISDTPDLADRHGNQLAAVRSVVPSMPKQAGSFEPPSIPVVVNPPPIRVEDVDLV